MQNGMLHMPMPGGGMLMMQGGMGMGMAKPRYPFHVDSDEGRRTTPSERFDAENITYIFSNRRAKVEHKLHNRSFESLASKQGLP